jgi:Phytochelatin synthase
MQQQQQHRQHRIEGRFPVPARGEASENTPLLFRKAEGWRRTGNTDSTNDDTNRDADVGPDSAHWPSPPSDDDESALCAPVFRAGVLAAILIATLLVVTASSSSTSSAATPTRTRLGEGRSSGPLPLPTRVAYDRQVDLWEAWKEQDLVRLAKVHRDRDHDQGGASQNDDDDGDETRGEDVKPSSPATPTDNEANPTYRKVLRWFRDVWGSVVDKSGKWWGRAAEDEQRAWNATATSAERTWKGIEDATGRTTESAKGWWSEATSNEAGREVWNGTVEATHRAWDNVEGVTEAAQQKTEQWWDEADLGSRGQKVWNATEVTAEHLAQGLEDESHKVKGGTEVWWNETVHSEQEWQHAAGQNLHAFGHTVRSWWNTTAAATQSKAGVLERNFAGWWHRAGQKERQWWNGTVDAFGRFGEHTRDGTEAWWNWTRTGVERGWETSEDAEEEWWNATRDWFASHASAVSNRTRAAQAGLPPPPRNLVYLNSTRAFQMLAGPYGWIDQSSHFFLYQQGWDSQINQAYCGVASAAAVLNSLKGAPQCPRLPVDPTYDPYPYATQQVVVRDACFSKHVSHEDKDFDGVLSFPGGLSLDQVGQLLGCFLDPLSWNVTVVHVDPSVSLDSVTIDLVRALHDPTSRVIVNIHRVSMGQQGGGHFSPLASYHPQERMFLFMDVAKYKYPPVWVPAEALYKAMQTEDRCGAWNFPIKRSQEDMLKNLTQAYRDNRSSPEEMEALMHAASEAVGCRTESRGYIIVRQTKQTGRTSK